MDQTYARTHTMAGRIGEHCFVTDEWGDKEVGLFLSTHQALDSVSLEVFMDDLRYDFFFGTAPLVDIPDFWEKTMEGQIYALLDLIPWTLQECAYTVIQSQEEGAMYA